MGLPPAAADRYSSSVQLFIWHQNQVHTVSGSVTSQINGFFNYADIRDPETVEFPVSRLFLQDVEYSVGAVSEGGVRPVLVRGLTCPSALASLAEKGSVEDSGPAGHTPNVLSEVARTDRMNIPDPVPNLCFPDLSMKDLDDRGNRYRTTLREHLTLSPDSAMKIPKKFSRLGSYGFAHRPMTYNYFNTYKANDTTYFWTLAFQEPSHMFNIGHDTHLTGLTRLERVDSHSNYEVLWAPFTVVHLYGTLIRARVVTYKDDHLNFSLYTVIEPDQQDTQCNCRMLAEVVPVCLQKDCSHAWRTPVVIFLQKVAGLTPMKSCCSTEHCLNPSYDWDNCR